MLHLEEFIGICLFKRFTFNDGTLGIGCGLKGVIETLARQFVGKSASIANENHIVCRMGNSVQRDIRTTNTTFLNTKLGEHFTEISLMARHILVRFQVGVAIHIATYA